MRVRFWGVRGSIPTPPTPEQITDKLVQAILQARREDVPADETAVREFLAGLDLPRRGLVGGNTTCIEISNDEDMIIIDAGSGIRGLGMHLMQREFGRGQGKAHLFFTHAHWDHLIGFPFFLPVYIPGNDFTFYAVGASPRTYLDYQQNAPRYFPVDVDYMRANKSFVRLEPDQVVEIGKFKVRHIALPHPGISYGYRIEDEHGSFVFVGDAEFNPLNPEQMQVYLDFFRNADALAFDSAYSLRDVFFSKIDWGHSSAMIGVDMASRANAKRLITFHHDIYSSDEQIWEIARAAQEYGVLQAPPNTPPVEVIPGYEGLTLELSEPLHVEWVGGQVGGTGVVQVMDSLDTVSAQKVEERLIEALRTAIGDRLVLDLRGVTHLNVLDLRALLTAQGTLPNSDISVVTADARIRSTLELVFGQRVFKFFDAFEDALSASDLQQRHLKLTNHTLANRYRLSALRAHNAELAIYAAHDQQVEQSVIAAVLNPNLPDEQRQSAMQLARNWRRIHHSNLLPVFDLVSAAGAQAVICEPPTGTSLRQHLRNQAERLPLETAISITIGLLNALAALHAEGLVHGHLRPATVFLGEDGRVQVAPNWATPGALVPSAYLSPEQIRGEAVDSRTDLYNLGLILYELVMGHHPFEAENDALMSAHQLQSTPKSPRALRPTVSRSLEHLMLKLLAKVPAERYASAEEVRRALDSFTIGASNPLQPVSLMQTGVPIVGREHEMNLLTEYLRRSLTGQMQVIFLSGDVGLGKTTLVNWLLARARAQNVRVVTGRSLNVDSPNPYRPITDALEDYLRHTPEIQRTAALAQVGNLPLLSDLLPSMRRLFVRSTGALTLTNANGEVDTTETRLYKVVTELFTHAAEQEPLLIFIDDLQWADANSLGLLRYMVQSLAPAPLPLLLITTYRNVELPAGHPLHGLRQSLNRLNNFHEITLQPLGTAAVQAQLSNLLEQPVPVPVAEAIYETTEGNPLFAEEIASALRMAGQIPATGAPWDMDALARIALPSSIVDVLEARLNYLSDPAAETLQLAAVIGNKFPFSLLQSVSGQPEDVLLAHLDEGLRLHLIRDLGRGDQLGFSHGLIHVVLENRISPPQRRLLHRKVAERLEARHSSPELRESVADQLAHHYREAGEIEQAVRYLIQAGQAATRGRSHALARQHFTQATALLDQQTSPVQSELRLAAIRGLADAQFAEALYIDSQASYEKALDLLPTGRDDRTAADLMRQIAQTLDRRGYPMQALDWRNRALQRLRASQTPNPGLESLLLVDVGWTLFRTGRKQEAQACFDEGQALIANNDDYLPEQAQLLTRLASVHYDRREFHTATRLAEQALNLQRTLSDTIGVARAYDQLARIYHLGDNWHAAMAHAQDGLHLAEHSNDIHTIMYLLDTTGTLAVQRGELDDAEQYSAELQRLAEAAAEPYHLAAAARLNGHLLLEQRNWQGAIQALDASLRQLDKLGDPEVGLFTWAFLAEAWLGVGKLSQAAHWANETLVRCQKQNESTITQTTASGIAYMVLGATATEEQRWDDAYEHLGQALTQHMALPNIFQAARCYFYLGLLEGARGQFDQADTMLAAAEETFLRLGSQLYVRRVRQSQQTFHQSRQLPGRNR